MTQTEVAPALSKVKPITGEDVLTFIDIMYRDVIGRGYHYMDCGGRYDHDWVNEIDRMIASFPEASQTLFRTTIADRMAEQGTHHIMQQGAGHASSLGEFVRKISAQNPNGNFQGYAVSGSFEDIHLGIKEWASDLSPEDTLNIERFGMRPFMRRYSPKNARYFGIEKDIHTVMTDFPNLLDLVFSDNSYMHLSVPWLALKRTAERLSIGGVAIIRTIHIPSYDGRIGTVESIDTFFDELRSANPAYTISDTNASKYFHNVVGIVKKENAPFVTNLRLGRLENEGHPILVTMQPSEATAGLISLDTL